MDIFIIFLLLIILTTIFISYKKICKKRKLKLFLESNFFIVEIKKQLKEINLIFLKKEKD